MADQTIPPETGEPLNAASVSGLLGLEIPERIRSVGSALTIGVFDGVHFGHQELLRRTQLAAVRQGLAAVAFTFRQHPLSVLAPAYAPPLILRPERKVQLLKSLGMHHVIETDFSPDFAALSPEEFVEKILVQGCAVRHLICGSDFRFGRGGVGDVSRLKQLARTQHRIEVEVVDDILLEGCVVRSTSIREAINRGEVRTAAQQLTRPHEICGTVVGGLARGRTIGFPTANLQVAYDAVIPLRGVYVTAVRAIGSSVGTTDIIPAMTNIGFNPTFGLERLSIETHLIDFSGDLVGCNLEVFFLARLRDEQKFSGVEALRDQLEKDKSSTRALLESPELKSLIAQIPAPLQ